MPTADDTPWQPWTPRVGQRVRVRYRGECPIHDGGRCHVWSDGFTGTVRECDKDSAFVRAHPGHEWFVVWGMPTGIWIGAHYAAAELEPLDAAP